MNIPTIFKTLDIPEQDIIQFNIYQKKQQVFSLCTILLPHTKLDQIDF